MKKVFGILGAVVVLSLFGGTIWFLWAKSHRPQTMYQTESAKIATIINKTVATGSVVPRQEVEIKPRVPGIIEKIAVAPGQVVKEGDLIAQIHLVPDMVTLNEARSRVSRAEIAAEKAKQDYERNQKLNTDGVIS